MNALPFPINPTVGQWWGNWTWNGVRWVCSGSSGLRVVTTVFTTSGPYMPAQGLVTAVVETVGGGGNGGAVSGTASTEAGGGGGASGGYSRITLPAALVAGGVQVTIGVGGVAPPLPPVGHDYADGGTATSFGALCVANGGGGGGGNASGANIWGYPGIGAPSGVGDLALPGNPGGIGTTANFGATAAINATGGAGASIMGGAGIAVFTGPGTVANGMPGLGPGAGGSGAAQNNVSAGAVGGQGANGVCIVTEYCWADAGDDGCDGTVNVDARVAVTDERHGRGSRPGQGGGGEQWGEFGDD